MKTKDKQQWQKATETEKEEWRKPEKEAQLQFGQKRTEHTNTAEARGLEQEEKWGL